MVKSLVRFAPEILKFCIAEIEPVQAENGFKIPLVFMIGEFADTTFKLMAYTSEHPVVEL